MRLILSFLLLFVSVLASGNPLFPKLNEINKCWSEQKGATIVSGILPTSETEWIQLHLASVEQTLRARDAEGLSTAQQQNRLRTLDHLHEYWQAGRFPQNEEFSYRLPIFIDKYNNFCAVGYLVKATGHEQISRKISANTNYAYVREMNYPELDEWAKAFGFTVDELAWIQPSYGPNNLLYPVGKGTNGIVTELFADPINQRLYVGGNFTTVDSAVSANNIAYLTESNGVYTWHNLGSGTNGTVNAIAIKNNDVYIGGSFTMAGLVSATNVARWNGSSWASMGCINGTVKDLVVYKGDVYASGQFGVCSPPTNVNFAKWTGTAWQAIAGLNGNINTMEVKDTMLILGGSFMYNGNTVNAIKWNPNTGFQTYGNVIRNEVNDFDIYKDTLYAVCKHTAGNDKTLFKKLYGNAWDSIGPFNLNYTNYLTINAACVLADTFLVGGDFNNQPNLGTMISNCLSMFTFGNFFTTNAPINKMAAFKGSIYVGGTFAYGNNKGIAKRVSNYPPVPAPTASAGGKHVCGSVNGSASASAYNGTPPYKYLWSTGDTTQTINNLLPGIYTVIVTDAANKKDTATFEVKIAIDKSLDQYGDVLAVKTFGGKYQWINCTTNQLLPGDTLATLAVKQTGEYAAIITANGCIDTTECYYVEPTEVKDLTDNGIRIYPNPVNAELNLEFDNLLSACSVTITDIAGQKLFTRNYTGSGKLKINVETLPKGLYMLNIKDADDRVIVSRFVKY